MLGVGFASVFALFFGFVLPIAATIWVFVTLRSIRESLKGIDAKLNQISGRLSQD